MVIITEFYKRLRALCEERGLTINELVKILDLSSGSPTAWKKGTTPRQVTVSKIAKYFGVSISELLGEAENTKATTGNGGHSKNAPDELTLTEGEMRILSAFREMSPERQKALAELLGISEGQK